jgi:hypothetical protein
MTEPAVHDVSTIVTPYRTRSRRAHDKKSIAWQKRVGAFVVEIVAPVLGDIFARQSAAERETLALSHRTAALENDNEDRAAIVKLKQKLAAIEDTLSNAMAYEGVWQRGRFYKKGPAVTFYGGLWHCVTPTELRPGTDSSWKLTVKNGSLR